MSTEFSSIQAAVSAIGRGEVVIVVDAEDRENEGDFICAAEKATPEVINFMLRGLGDFCMAILPETCERLDLKPLVDSNTTRLETAFLTPLDHKSSRTGITAQERSDTVQAIVSPASNANDSW